MEEQRRVLTKGIEDGKDTVTFDDNNESMTVRAPEGQLFVIGSTRGRVIRSLPGSSVTFTKHVPDNEDVTLLVATSVLGCWTFLSEE